MKSILILFSVLCGCGYLLAQNPSPQPLPYCKEVNSTNISSQTGQIPYYYCFNIGQPTGASTNFNMNGPQSVSYEPTDHAHIYPTTHIKPVGNGFFKAQIKEPEMTVAWFAPNATPGWADLYETMELGFDIPDTHPFLDGQTPLLNAYNPDELDLQIEVIAPDGATKTQYGFYYVPYTENTATDTWVKDLTSGSHLYPWRFRFAPDQEGFWTYKIKMIRNFNGDIKVSRLTITIGCSGSLDTHKGRLVVQTNSYDPTFGFINSSNPYLRYENGDSFFAVGNGIANVGEWNLMPSKLGRHINGLSELADAGGNYTRLELGPWNGLPDWPDITENSISTPHIDDYTERQDNMYAYDKLIELCEDRDIYYTIFRHHVEVLWELNPNFDPITTNTLLNYSTGWERNPYKNHFGLTDFEDYFTNPEVLKAQLNTLRYICARWGYNSNFAFYGYSEVEKWLNYNPTNGTAFLNWLQTQKNYVKNILNYDFGFTSSFGTKYKFIEDFHFLKEEMDIVESMLHLYIDDVVHYHAYGDKKDYNYKDRSKSTVEALAWGKPALLDEVGLNGNRLKIYCCTGIDYHNTLWSTSMMGSYGAGLDWWWDRGIHDNDYQWDIANLKHFMDGEDLFYGNYYPDKWRDGVTEDYTIENFFLVRGNRERILGWAHNSWSYWRDYSTTEGDCIYSLVNYNAPYQYCTVGTTLQINSNTFDPCNGSLWDCWQRPYMFSKQDDATQTNSDNFIDGPILSGNFDVKVKGLKHSNIPFYKEYYLIELFHTKGDPNDSYITNGIVNSTDWGNFTFSYNFSIAEPDIAYKMTYLGRQKINSGHIDNPADTVYYFGQNKLERIQGHENMNQNVMIIDELTVYPNPTNSMVNIFSNRDKIGEILLFDLFGKQIEKTIVDGFNYSIDLTNLSSGVYFLKINDKKYKIIKTDTY